MIADFFEEIVALAIIFQGLVVFAQLLQDSSYSNRNFSYIEGRILL